MAGPSSARRTTSRIKRIVMILAGVALAGGVLSGFLPQPIEVETATVSKGLLQVTVNEDGKTRIKDRYVVSMPVLGQMRRITLKAGDTVSGGKTLLTTVEPGEPDLLNPRTFLEAQARVKAAEAAVKRLASGVERAVSEKELADKSLERVKRLQQQNASSQDLIEAAELRGRTRNEDLRAAKFAQEVAQFELEQARAALNWVQQGVPTSEEPQPRNIDLVAPVSGRVLKVWHESSALIPAGTPLIEIGEPSNLELQIDVLSHDAVKIAQGAKVLIEHWGGDKTLEGRVRVIEPAAFTKISALGVEEQRVYVIADLTSASEERPSLGDAYRIEARIVTWEGKELTLVPASSCFRQGDGWAVFAVKNHRVQLRPVKIGHRNAASVEIVDGLGPGEMVVLHPGDRLADGVSVSTRR